MSTAEEREEYGECALSRFEAYDEAAGKHIANIAYTPFACRIVYLSVDEKYRKKGIGKELAKRAIEDMRAMHNCREVDLISSSSSEKFWETLGAKPADSFRHVFPEGCVVGQNPSSHLSLDSKQSTKDLAWFYDQYATVI